MSAEQYVAVAKLFAVITAREPVDFHHGDCIGGDQQLALLAFRLGAEVHAWPSVDPQYRAYAYSHVVNAPMTNFARNRVIVRTTELLVACPYQNFEADRGGTWYTISYARKHGHPVWLAWPDGRVEAHPGPGQNLTA